MSKADIGLIGLAVMGQNLVLNMERNGFTVAVYNRTTSKTTEFLEGNARGKKIIGAETLEEFVNSLASPRKMMIMVKAGRAVDAVIEQLIPLLDEGDLIIDGGNSHFPDTERRSGELEAIGLRYLGVGVSGGEEGALWGPSMMPGGQEDAYELVRPIYEPVAAVAEGEPCVAYLGPRGAGHYVKMVHNGIEYGMMQAYAEGFALLRGKQEFNLDLAQVAELWRHSSVVRSWLLDLSAAALAEDQELSDVAPVVADSGEGRWTAIEAIDQGQALPVISLALQMRFSSQDGEGYANKLLAMMRNAFGGHKVEKH